MDFYDLKVGFLYSFRFLRFPKIKNVFLTGENAKKNNAQVSFYSSNILFQLL